MRMPLKIALAGALALPLFLSSAAQAGIASCGDINVQASATCEVKTNCQVDCTPITMELACEGELYAACSGQCTGSATATCTGTCQSDCTGKCTVNPPSFDCQASCEADCSGGCTADCSSYCSTHSSQANCQAECQASCKGRCQGDCSASCTGTPPSADCNAKCQAKCQGECKAEANVTCQGECNAGAYATCQTRIQGGCTAACDPSKPGGLFCNGQYVDSGNNLQNCIDALNAVLNVKVSGSASCSGNSCQAEGKASAGCATAPVRGSRGLGAAAGLLAALGALVVARRRRRA
jgi:hypothetical protein